MPTFRKLTPAEILSVKGIGTRKAIEIEYDGHLAGFAAGDHGEATLGEGERRMTVMSRLKAAAGRKSLKLVFKRTTSPSLLRFEVVADTGGAAISAAVGGEGKPARGGKLGKR